MEKGKLFTLKNPKAVVSEAFRSLRTNIQFANIDKKLKTIVVTSSSSGEGKTTIICNLAVSIAQSEKSILLIDCDLRKPRVHKTFGISNIEGLTNILMGERRLEDVRYKGDKDIQSLSIITSGPIPPNPSELVGSHRMREFLEDMKYQFDIVLIDSPPVNIVTDSAILSTLVDGTIIVIEAGKTEIGAAVNCKESLDKVNANIIGVVINKIPVKGDSYYNYRYYQYEEYLEYEKKPKSRKKRRRNKW